MQPPQPVQGNAEPVRRNASGGLEMGGKAPHSALLALQAMQPPVRPVRPVRPGHRGGSSRGHSGCMRIFAHFNIEPCVTAHPNRSAIRRTPVRPSKPVQRSAESVQRVWGQLLCMGAPAPLDGLALLAMHGVANEPQAPHSLTSGRPGRPGRPVTLIRPCPAEMDELLRSLWTT